MRPHPCSTSHTSHACPNSFHRSPWKSIVSFVLRFVFSSVILSCVDKGIILDHSHHRLFSSFSSVIIFSLRKDTVMVYWGQQSFRNELKLSEYCKGDRYDVIVVSLKILRV